jgi:hypothetical protein
MYEPSSFATETLRDMQKQALEDFVLRTAPPSDVKLRAKLAAMLGRLRGTISTRDAEHWQADSEKLIDDAYNAPRISSLQDPIDQALLSRVVQETEQRTCRVENVHFPERTLVASLPIGQMNAVTIHLPQTDEYLILFQRGLFGLLNLFARAISSVWPEGKPGEGAPLLVKREELKRNFGKVSDPEYFLGVLQQSLIRGNPNGFAVIPQSPSRSGTKEALLLNAEVFILGHEYGHIQRGHFKAQRDTTVKLGNRALSVTSRSHQEEFAADLTGFEYANCFGSLGPIQQYLAYCGTCFFFSCQDIVEEALLLLAGENDATRARDTHPTGMQRREAITNVLRFQIGEKNAELLIRGYAEMHWILQEFWRIAKPGWLEIGRTGAIASPVWRSAVESYERQPEVAFQEVPPDSTTRALGMPDLRDMESFKGVAFLALLDLVNGSSSDRSKAAADWAIENAHIIVYSLVSEIAYGAPERREGFLSYLLENGPGLGQWVSTLRFVIGRYSDNRDLAGVPEVMMAVTSGMEYIMEIARQIRADEHIDYVKTLFDVEYRAHQRWFSDKPNEPVESSDASGGTIS